MTSTTTAICCVFISQSNATLLTNQVFDSLVKEVSPPTGPTHLEETAVLPITAG